MSTQSRESLESAAGLLEQDHPGLHVRFVRVMGRRLSHIAGSASPDPGLQVLVTLSDDLAAVLSGRIPFEGEELEAVVRSALGRSGP